ncbi:MAG: type IV pilus secretin PilQ [Candidatus Omnitrophota bacterium]
MVPKITWSIIFILLLILTPVYSQGVQEKDTKSPGAMEDSLESSASEIESSQEQDVQEVLNEDMASEDMREAELFDLSEEDTEEPIEGEPRVIQEGNVTLDFRDADIRNVLKILAYKSGMNIVPGPDVTGLVTIQLTDVPWKQALEVILENYGYSYERKGNIIMVTTIDNLKKRREDALLLAEQEPLETRSFILNFARASIVITSVEKLKTGRGNVHYDERTNTIIIRDTVSNMELIEKIVKELDATTPQVLIEAKIIETTLSDTENLGIDWVAQAQASAAGRPITWPFIQSDDNKFLTTNFPAASGAGSIDDSTSNFTFGTLNLSQLSAVLELLKSRTDTNIISNPRIVTLDNETATINVGSQYPLPQYTYNEEQARLQVSGWEYKDIGVIFKVTPHVNRAGFVTLDVEPTVTDILEKVTVENTQVPRLSNEAVKTRVMIKESETLVIAGLIKNSESDTRKKLPFLGDIPGLGLLFQKKEKTISKTDLLIFITPHIITAQIEDES